MKPFTIIAWGVFFFFLLLGFGACCCLVGLGASAGKPQIIDIKLPMKK